jgi:hypothetical protein
MFYFMINFRLIGKSTNSVPRDNIVNPR